MTRARYGLVVRNVSRTNENQRWHPEVAYVREDRLIWQRHVIVVVVLRSCLQEPSKMLARSVMTWNDEVGILNSNFDWIFRVLKRHLSHRKVLRVWKTVCFAPPSR
jgi:hypothetical protein